MVKQKYVEGCFAELRNDMILLEIANFHKYVGSLANEIVKCSQIETSKRQMGHKNRGSIKTLTFTAKLLPVS